MARRLTTLPLQCTTPRLASQFKALLSRMVKVLVVPEFSPTPCAAWNWSLLLPSSPAPWLPVDGLPPALLQLDRPLIQVSFSSFKAATVVSSHHLLLELFLKVLLFLGFEARHPSEELPRFLLLGLEALPLFNTRSPMFTISQQLH